MIGARKKSTLFQYVQYMIHFLKDSMDRLYQQDTYEYLVLGVRCI
jgi:hypothetical protein